MAYKMRRGPKPRFNELGSSPVKKTEAPKTKLTQEQRQKNLLKAVPNEEEFNKLSKIDQEGFTKKAKEVGLPMKPKKKSPAKQAKTKGFGPSKAFGGVKNPELTKTKKSFSTKVMKDGSKTNVHGIDLGKDPHWQPYKKKSPTKQRVKTISGEKIYGLGPRAKNNDLTRKQRATNRGEMSGSTKDSYWYKIDGKPVTKAQYLKYENKPGSMEGGGKTTNNPEVYGRKASNYGRGPNTKIEIMAYKPFKMKGHTLPGIKQREADKMEDGRPGSSAFQYKESPAKQKDTDGKSKVRKKNTSFKGDIMTNTETGDTYNMKTGKNTPNIKPERQQRPDPDGSPDVPDGLGKKKKAPGKWAQFIPMALSALGSMSKNKEE